ncbi:citrate lyase acyl carrier protein [Vibrio ruber]|uniref:Citrate lyase acyl carrier protein n=1 Tax=Vibrio ruber (strain DSM 16370 / JCM 11486 / BCRC 17186 / CECT 7878 / LMG 23124 / VR1) TaxID=1123498 RepID=A0A1R4LIV2_VIBR1|nr:citrate lyase acyl carrier protein [Vibrio ruber]WNJ95226.1 citrate lyase acyl carrier protein [Vibrio ruber]SJN56438.1 Citrate lyase acyl carrier protein [Vibrio ruber DSM 16370]
MEIKQPAFAGTLESSDLQVRIAPNHEGGIIIHLDSTVQQQFGEVIRHVVLDSLQQLKVADAILTIEDKGALDCVIQARVQAAVMRACGVEQIDWSLLS